MTKQALDPRVLLAPLGKYLSACLFLILFCPSGTARAQNSGGGSSVTIELDLAFQGSSIGDLSNGYFEGPITPEVTMYPTSYGVVYVDSGYAAIFKGVQPGDIVGYVYSPMVGEDPNNPPDPRLLYCNVLCFPLCSCTSVGTVEGISSGPGVVRLLYVPPYGSIYPNPNPSGASTFTNGSAHLKFSLGNQANGSSAGSIQLIQQALTADSYSTASLIAGQLSGTALYTTSADPSSALDDDGGYLRQVFSGNVLTDIITQSATKYSIAFYQAAQVTNPNAQSGLYTTSGSPFVTYTIENPDASGNTTTQLKVTESRPGQLDNVSLFTIDASGSSTLTTGNGTWMDSKVHGTDTNGNPTIDHQVSTLVYGQPVLASRTIDTYQNFPWGQSLIQEVVDPDGAKLTTTYTYYDSTADADAYHYGLRQSVVNADGSWEVDDWLNGTQIETLTPWKDSPGVTVANASAANCHALIVNSNETDEYVLGQQVSKTVAGTTSSTGATTSTIFVSAADTTGLTTTTTNNSDGTVAEVDSSDGTVERHTYTTITFQGATATRELVRHGTASMASGVSGTSVCNVNITNAAGQLIEEQTYASDGSSDPSTNSTNLIAQTTHTYDASGNPTQDTDLNGNVTYQAGWAGNLKQWEKDAQGIETDYTYDGRNRMLTSTKKGAAGNGNYAAQPDIVTTYGYDAADRQTSVTVAAGGLTQASTTAYDLAGRVTKQIQNGLETGTAYALGGHPVTVTNPNGSTQITDYYLDGQIKSVKGTAQVATAYDYQLNSTNFRQALVTTGPDGSTRTTTTTTDWLGRTVEVDTPTFGGGYSATVSFYNASGQLYKVAQPGLADTLHVYDAVGNQIMSGLDMDGDGTLDTSSSSGDRVTATSTVYSNGCRVTTTTVYGDASGPTAQTIQTEQLAGLPAGTSANVTVAGPNGATTTTTAVDTGNKLVTTTINVPGASNQSVQVNYNGLLVSATTPAVQSPVLYTYDALGRLSTATDPGTGAITTTTYDPVTGQVATMATAHGALNTSTVNTYYGASDASPGQLKTSTVNGMVTTYTYNLQNQVTGVSGNTYPLAYVYDGYGALQTLTTTGAAGNALTTWVYDSATGLLQQKQDNSGKGPSYTYWPSGRVKTRTWARGVTTTYHYDKGGSSTSLGYSDGTPAVSITNNRLGQPATVTDAAGTHTLTYKADGQLAGDSIGGNGLLAGISVNIGYDGYLRRNSLTASGGSLSYSAGYGYDGATGNLSSVTDNVSGNSATYGYQSNSTQLATTTFNNNGATRLVTTRTRDGLGRLSSITNTAGGTAVSSHAYVYNAQGQRSQATREDRSYWSYGYNNRGELTSGHHSWSNGHAIAGQQFDYNYDSIGNRINTTTNGRSATYTPNALNQYTQRDVPGAVDVLGTADPSATVTVNNQPASTRAGRYFDSTVGVGNTNGPVDQPVDVLAFKGGAGAGGADVVSETQGNVFVPQTPEVFHYDDDGNLTQDGHWTYTWDAENRLVNMTANANVPASAKKKLVFAYDWMGRRVLKQVYSWNTTTNAYNGTASTNIAFVYDAWNLMAELNSSNGNAPLRTYLWGRDLSGSLQGAGGVGGLLGINDYTSGSMQTHYTCYDGDGNIVGFVRATDGSNSATYGYSAFGETIAVAGDIFAWANPLRWSSKYCDFESELSYYGYRYYDSRTAHWLSRDPLYEMSGVEPDEMDSDTLSGINLHQFVGNNPTEWFDGLGLAATKDDFKVAFLGAGGIDPNHGQWKIFTKNIFGSRDVNGAISAVIKYFDTNGDGKLDSKDCPPFRIRVVGYSWGGWSAIQFAKKLGNKVDAPNSNLEIAISTLDPVKTIRSGTATLPSYAIGGLNYYQQNGCYHGCPGPGFWYKGNPVSGESNASWTATPYPPYATNPPKQRNYDHIAIQSKAPDIVASVNSIKLK